MIAIVGGLLVSRFLSIDSTQQGLKAQIAEYQDLLDAADKRVEDLAGRLREIAIRDSLDDSDVLDLMIKSTSPPSPGQVRRLSGETSLSDDELTEEIEAVHSEVQAASTFLRSALPSSQSLDPDEWSDVPSWNVYYSETTSLPAIRNDWAWEYVFNKIVDTRTRQAYERPSGPFGFTGVAPISLATFTPAWVSQRAAERVDALEADHEAAVAAREDIERKYLQLYGSFIATVRPDKPFAWGVGVLVYFTVVGVIYPIWVLRGGVEVITPEVANVYWWFLSGLTALLGYVVVLAVRLIRRRHVVDTLVSTRASDNR
ncbi:hypothetical protein [Pseudonocardia endophytica]|nr:hypothetical protein [Pseudonocardia endophytica]